MRVFVLLTNGEEGEGHNVESVHTTAQGAKDRALDLLGDDMVLGWVERTATIPGWDSDDGLFSIDEHEVEG